MTCLKLVPEKTKLLKTNPCDITTAVIQTARANVHKKESGKVIRRKKHTNLYKLLKKLATKPETYKEHKECYKHERIFRDDGTTTCMRLTWRSVCLTGECQT